MNMNQLARNSQVQAARQRLAAQGGIPGGAYMGNVAGCGGMVAASGWPPNQSMPVFNQVPQNCPPVPAAQGPGPVLRQRDAPLSAVVQVEEVGSPTCIELCCKGGSVFYGSGFRSLNDPFQVMIESITSGSLNYDLICGDAIDAAYWNTDDCWCAMEFGCITCISPVTICFSAFGTPSVLPYINVVIVGCRDSGWMDCGYRPDFYPPGYGWPGAVPVPPGGGGGGVPQGPGNLVAPGAPVLP
jgi:hypothetical protein